MKTIANRMMTVAAGVLCLGAVAFGQTRMTAEIPFAFRTVGGVLPAGQYQIERIPSVALPRVVALRNVGTGKIAMASAPMFDAYSHPDEARLEFLCGTDTCTLKAIRSSNGSFVYDVPAVRAKHGDAKPALVTVPLKTLNGD